MTIRQFLWHLFLLVAATVTLGVSVWAAWQGQYSKATFFLLLSAFNTRELQREQQ